MGGWMEERDGEMDGSVYHVIRLLFSLSFSCANFALAHCAMALPAVLSQGRRGHSFATCLLRQTGGGASGVEIPCKEL